MSENKTLSYLQKKYEKDPSYQDVLPFNSKADIETASKSLHQVQATPIIERINVINPILCESGSMMIFGEAGVGKSYFTLSLAYALSRGGNFLKYGVPIPQKVAYFDGELGCDDMHRYLDQIIKFQGVSDFPENLVLTSYDDFPNQHIPRLEADTNLYFEYLMDNGFNGAIWDNLATCTDLDENDPKTWKIIQKLILRLRAHKVFSIFVHHAGSDKTKDRGITARRDILHTVISLQKIEDHIGLDSRIKVVYQKGRHLSGLDKQPFEAIHKQDGSWETQEIERSNYELVIDCLLAGYSGSLTSKQAGITPGMVTKYKQRAISEGKIRTYPNGKIITL